MPVAYSVPASTPITGFENHVERILANRYVPPKRDQMTVREEFVRKLEKARFCNGNSTRARTSYPRYEFRPQNTAFANPYATSYNRDYKPRRPAQHLSLRVRSADPTHLNFNSQFGDEFQSAGYGHSHYDDVYAYRGQDPNPGYRQGFQENNPQPQKSFIRWRFPRNGELDSYCKPDTDKAEEVLSRMRRPKSEYQANYRGMQSEEAHRLQAEALQKAKEEALAAKQRRPATAAATSEHRDRYRPIKVKTRARTAKPRAPYASGGETNGHDVNAQNGDSDDEQDLPPLEAHDDDCNIHRPRRAIVPEAERSLRYAIQRDATHYNDEYNTAPETFDPNIYSKAGPTHKHRSVQVNNSSPPPPASPERRSRFGGMPAATPLSFVPFHYSTVTK